MSIEHVVLWNGARRGPGGPYLIAETEPMPEPETDVSARLRQSAEFVLAVIDGRGPSIRTEIAAATPAWAQADLTTVLHGLERASVITWRYVTERRAGHRCSYHQVIRYRRTRERES